MLIAAAGFYFHQQILLLIVLFLLGTQSAFFGPLKYAILPEQLQPKELMAGNGLIEAGTFIAILLGMVLGGSMIMFPSWRNHYFWYFSSCCCLRLYY